MATQLDLTGLNERHPGVTKAIGDCYAEAATVCLNRHHQSPVFMDAQVSNKNTSFQVSWYEPTKAIVRAYANDIDATEYGAYGLSLAAVEAIEGLVAISRAETLTGADYYIAPIGSDPEDLENAVRLEVSGVDAGG